MVFQLAVALVVLQLALVYPEDHYLVLSLLALGTLLAFHIEMRGKGWTLHRRPFGELLVGGAILLVGGALVPKPLRTLPMCIENESRWGTVFAVERRGVEKLVRLKSAGIGWEIRVPDLPWQEPFGVGAVVSFTPARCRPSSELQSLPPWDYAWHLFRQGILMQSDAEEFRVEFPGAGEKALDRFVGQLLRKLPDSEALSLLLAANLGLGELLSRDTEQLFRDTATTHLLVVSGFHLSLVARAFGAALLALFLRFPMSVLIVPGPLIEALGGLTAAGAYATTIGLSATIGRALVAHFLTTLTVLTGRSAMHGLCLSFIFVQICWPLSLFEPGCQLTFAALAGLTLAQRVRANITAMVMPENALEILLESARARRRKRFLSFVVQPFVESFLVWLSTSLVTVLWFAQVVPGAPLINVLVIPLFTGLVIFSGVGALLFFLLFRFTLPVEIAIFGSAQVISLLEWIRALSTGSPFGIQTLRGVGLVVTEMGLLGMFLSVSWAVYRRGAKGDGEANVVELRDGQRALRDCSL